MSVAPVIIWGWLLSVLPLIAAFSPRFMALAPVLMGLSLLPLHKITFNTLPKKFLLAIGTVIAVALISGLWAVDPDFALKRTGKISLILFGGILMISGILSLKENEMVLKRFSQILPLTMLITGCILIFELMTNAAIYQFFRPDLSITPGLAVTNRGCVVFILAFLPVIHSLRHASYDRKTKILFLGFLIFLAYWIIYLTDSQSVQLAFLVSLIFTFLFPYKSKAAWYGLLTFMLAGIWSAPWLAQYLFKVLPDIGQDIYLFQTSYAADRLEIWDFISRRIPDHPLIGHGIEATRAIKDFDSARLYYADNYVLHPHNFIIQIWFEFGLLGVVILSGLLIGFFEALRRTSVAQARLYLPVTMACLSVATTGYGFWQSWWLGTLLVTASFSLFAGQSIKNNTI